jgi:hypothetical protein
MRCESKKRQLETKSGSPKNRLTLCFSASSLNQYHPLPIPLSDLLLIPGDSNCYLDSQAKRPVSSPHSPAHSLGSDPDIGSASSQNYRQHVFPIDLRRGSQQQSATVRNSSQQAATVPNSPKPVPQQSATVRKSPQESRNSSQRSAAVRNSPATVPQQPRNSPRNSPQRPRHSSSPFVRLSFNTMSALGTGGYEKHVL